MIYEPMNEAHLPEISEMYIAAFNAPPWNDRWTNETVTNRLRQMMNCDGFMGLVCVEDDGMNGMILGNIEHFYDCTHFSIKEFCVRLDCRGKGVGTQLLSEFEKRLAERGVDEVYLFTSRGDETEAFYQKRGFDSWNDMVMMGKSLHGAKLGRCVTEKTVLLVVDVQTALMESHPYNEIGFIENIRQLIQIARQNNIEVVYVRHDGGVGDELEKNTKGWEIYHKTAPSGTDKIFDKNYNSAFKETGLHDYLSAKGVETIILVGMATEYCIDATCKAAFEHGYKVVIPHAATTTFDNEFLSGESSVKYFEEKIWNGRFASVIPIDEVFK